MKPLCTWSSVDDKLRWNGRVPTRPCRFRVVMRAVDGERREERAITATAPVAYRDLVHDVLLPTLDEIKAELPAASTMSFEIFENWRG